MPKLKNEAKVAIVTALISSICTILVAFIGIVPSLRQSDRNKIEELSNSQGKPDDVYEIRGSVRSTDNSPLSGTELYAARADITATPDDNGRFLFENVLLRPYRVIVVDQTGQTRRLLIAPDDSPPETETAGLAITYTFSKK